MYTVYGDESHDETKQRTFAVGTVCGHKTEWDIVSERWQARLGEIVFHAADCEAGHADFKGVPRAERLGLYKDLCTIVCESKLFGNGESVMLSAFRQIFKSATSEMPYYMCFSESAYKAMKLAAMCIPRGTIEVIFDRHPETEHNAGLLYQYFVNSQVWRGIAEFSDKVSFATRKTVGIQVADLIARETMKEMDNIVGQFNRPMRKSMEALRATKRFDFKYWGPSLLLEFDAYLKSIGFDEFEKGRREYQVWLDQKNVQDNMTSRITYGMELSENKQ